MRVPVLAVMFLVATAGCGGRSPEPAPATTPLRSGPTPTDAGAEAAPPPSSCPAGQITIESCVVGGMPREDGTANVSCGTTCSEKPPAQTADQSCKQVSPDHYRCTGYAP